MTKRGVFVQLLISDNYGGLVYKFCLYISFILIGIMTGWNPETAFSPRFVLTNCLAMEDMADKVIRRNSVIIEDNELYQNNFSGIRIRGSMPVIIKTCKINSNGGAGIAIDKQAQVMITSCNLFGNHRAGVNIDNAARATLESNRIYRNKMAGVRICRSGRKERHVSEVKIAGNRIYMNDESGIRSMLMPDGEVDLSLIGNDIYRNGKAGVRIKNNTQLIAKRNNIFKNGTAGIISHESAIPPTLDIYQNKINSNSGPGIHALTGITGKIGIRNNWIFNNQQSGIVCGLWNKPGSKLLHVDIINNTIVSNGSSDQGAGIRNDSEGKVIVINNILAYNYATGIKIKGCRGYSYNLLFANGDVANCCDDPFSAPSGVEKEQFARCRGRGKGGLICDPLFVDPDNYNFYLQDESPAVDAGKDRNDMGATGGPYATR